MKTTFKAQAKVKKMGLSCTITEYLIAGEQNINYAMVTLNGRYPENGLVSNEICKELAYIIDGEGTLIINGIAVHLKSGDVVLIEPNEEYYWEGHMDLLLSCAPAWYPEQHKSIGVAHSPELCSITTEESKI